MALKRPHVHQTFKGPFKRPVALSEPRLSAKIARNRKIEGLKCSVTAKILGRARTISIEI